MARKQWPENNGRKTWIALRLEALYRAPFLGLLFCYSCLKCCACRKSRHRCCCDLDCYARRRIAPCTRWPLHCFKRPESSNLYILLLGHRFNDIAQDRFEGAPRCSFAQVGFLRNDLDKFALVHPCSPWILGGYRKARYFRTAWRDLKTVIVYF